MNDKTRRIAVFTWVEPSNDDRLYGTVSPNAIRRRSSASVPQMATWL